jgi:hydroxypyruvate isomerase
MHRRDFMGAMGAVASLTFSGVALADSVTPSQQAAFDSPPYPEKGDDVKPLPRKGRIKQCVTRGCFSWQTPGEGFPPMGGPPFEEQCRQAARLGIHGFDLSGPNDWPMLKKYGLVSTMIYGIGTGPGAARGSDPAPVAPGGARDGRGPRIIDKEMHDLFVKIYSDTIDLAAENKFPNIILTTGPRGTIGDEEGQDALTALLNSLKARAEDKGINLCAEMQSTNKNAPLANRTMFDHLAWGFEVMKRVNSPRVKVLFDIFHAQVMDGNIVETIRENWQWIGHFHTGGVPPLPGGGMRNELDHTQELNYPFIMKTIADLGFTDYVAHEYRPAPGNDPIASLEKCIRICDA